MAWRNMPLIGGGSGLVPSGSATYPSGMYQSVRETDWIIQFWEACRERMWVTGERYWPAQSHVWYSGVVHAATDTTIRQNDSPNWGSGGSPPWYGNPTDDDFFAPDTWGVFIEGGGHKDHKKVIYSDIVSWQSGLLNIKNIRNYITSKEIPSYESLVGQHFFITRRHMGETNPALRWANRWPQWANAQELDYGIVASGNASGILTDTTKNWRPNQFFNEELIFQDASGIMWRAPIGSGDMINPVNPGDTFYEHTLVFTPQSGAKPEGRYAIIKPNGVYRLGREKHQPWAFYRGAMSTAVAHFPDDTTGDTFLPAGSVTWESYAEGTFDCVPQQFPIETPDTAVDWDAKSDLFEECGAPLANDQFYSPHLWKTWRSLQVFLEDNCHHFTEKKTPNNIDYLSRLTPASMFRAAQIGLTQGRTLTLPSEYASGIFGSYSGYVAPTTFPYYPIDVYYEVDGTYDSELNPISQGTATMTSPTTIMFGGGTLEIPTASGKWITLSTGWQRLFPLQFRHLFGKTCFIPDVNKGVVVDPAILFEPWEDNGSIGVGTWVPRQASSGYLESYRAPSGGDVAIYLGDNWNDPIEGSFKDDPRLEYYDRFYQGRHLPDVQRHKIHQQLSGTVTSGTRYWLRDDTKNWYTDNWYTGGVGYIETGNSSGGSQTSLDDDDKDVGDETGAFWLSERFPFFASPYRDFIIEIDMGSGNWYKRPITNSNTEEGSVHVEWEEPLPESAEDKAWRIREPKYEINRWRDRKFYLRKPDGTVITRRCKWSDDNTLWPETPFPEGSGAAAGDLYAIVDIDPGTSWMYSRTAPTGDAKYDFYPFGSGFMCPASGVDKVRTGVTVPSGFHNYENENLPTIMRKFGRFSKYDLVHYPEFYNQIYRGINSLVWTLGKVRYYESAVDGVPGPEEVLGGGEVEEGAKDFEAMKDAYEASWNSSTSMGEAAFGPFGEVSYEVDEEFINIRGASFSAYADVDEPPLLTQELGIQHSTDAWAYTTWRFAYTDASGIVHHEINDTDAATRLTMTFSPGNTNAQLNKWSKLGSAPEGTDFPRVFVDAKVNDFFPMGRDLMWTDGEEWTQYPHLWFAYDTVYMGWQSTDSAVIHKWDGPNGLKFISPSGT